MFQAPKLTNAGKALYYENIAGQALVFTKIKMGQGHLSTPIATMTDLVDEVVSLDVAITNEGDAYVNISGSFSNAGMTEGFYWREVGVFAADPNYPNDRSKDIMYCYQNAYDTADFIPAASVETVEKHITVPLIVGDVDSVSCVLDQSLVFATLQDIQIHDQGEDAHPYIQGLIAQNAQDIAALLQLMNALTSQVGIVDERLGGIESMCIHNDYTAPIAVDTAGLIIIVDDDGSAVVADWQYVIK